MNIVNAEVLLISTKMKIGQYTQNKFFFAVRDSARGSMAFNINA